MNVNSSSSSSSSTTSGLLSTQNRLAGLISGIDTESLVLAATSKTQSKIDKQVQNKQKYSWKQSAVRTIAEAMTEFNTKYLSYSTSKSNNILSSAFFNVASAKSSSSLVGITATSTAARNAAANMRISKIAQLATATSLRSNTKVMGESSSLTTGVIEENWVEKSKTVKSDSSLTFEYDGKEYTLEVSSNIDLSQTSNYSKLESTLYDQIKKQKLESDIDLTIDKDGKISISAADDSKEVKVTGGNIADAFGITGQSGNSISGEFTEMSYNRNLGDSLSGASITVDLDGISKKINFDASDVEKYNTPDKLAEYLQDKLTTAYGTVSYIDSDGKTQDFYDADGNKVSKVSVNLVDGKLTFKTNEVKFDADGNASITNGNTSIFSITASDSSAAVGADGALKVETGTANRLNTTLTLDEVASQIGLTADSDGKYKMNINGVEFSFDGTKTVSNMMSEINSNADANVTMSYSSASDTFSLIYDDTGAQGSITVQDSGSSNLATKLFGANANDLVQRGQDAQIEVSFDNGSTYQTVTRSSNSFSLNGVTLELNGTTDSTVSQDAPITFSSETNTQTLVDKIKDFINDYNNIVEMIGKLTTEARAKSDGGSYYDPLTDSQRKEMDTDEIKEWETKAKQGILRNDSTLTTLNNKLRETMMSLNESSGYKLLGNIGISTESGATKAYSKLVIDEDKLYEACSTNPDEVEKLFTDSENGIAKNLKNVFTDYVGYTGSSGILYDLAGSSKSSVDQSSYGTTIDDINDIITQLKTRLKNEQEREYSKYTAMETALSKLNSQASMFTSS